MREEFLKPAPLLLQYENLFTGEDLHGPVLDLACGDGHNGIYLAKKGPDVILCDVSTEALKKARGLAVNAGVAVEIRQLDLERKGRNPLEDEVFGAILVFRYLHRPLIPGLKRALEAGGLLVYETFTTEQPKFGKPRNPDFLLKPGELRGWFHDWKIFHSFEGILQDPERAVAQIVCQKPFQQD